MTLLQLSGRDKPPGYLQKDSAPAAHLRDTDSASDLQFVILCCPKVCPRDYTPTLLQYISRENLPEYLGGGSKATLLDDAGPWNDRALIDEIEAELKRVSVNRCMCYEPVCSHLYPTALLEHAGPWNDAGLIDEIEAGLQGVHMVHCSYLGALIVPGCMFRHWDLVKRPASRSLL